MQVRYSPFQLRVNIGYAYSNGNSSPARRNAMSYNFDMPHTINQSSELDDEYMSIMAIARSRNSSLNFEVLVLFPLCLYAIFHLQSCILNPPSDISVFPRAHATVFVNNRRPLSSLHSSHHGRRILRLPSKAGLPSNALTSMRCGLLSYTICCFCMLVCCGDVQVNLGPAANSMQDAFSTVRSSGKNGITIGHTNVGGLYANLAQVKLLAFNTNLDVLAISETHLSSA